MAKKKIRKVKEIDKTKNEGEKIGLKQTVLTRLSNKKINSSLYNFNNNRTYSTLSRKTKVPKSVIFDIVKEMQPLVTIKKYR